MIKQAKENFEKRFKEEAEQFDEAPEDYVLKECLKLYLLSTDEKFKLDVLELMRTIVNDY